MFLSCLHRTVDYIFYGEKNENVKENVRVLSLSNSPSVFVYLFCSDRTVDYIFYGEKNENVKEKMRVLSLSQILLRFSCSYPVYIERLITSFMEKK